MKENAKSKTSKVLRQAAIAMVAIGTAAVPALHAKPNSNKATDKPANVVAHVQLSGGSAMRMLLVKKNGREYLLLELGSSPNLAILDVSEPSQPRAIDTNSASTGTSSAEVKLVADTLTLFGTSDAGKTSSSSPKEIRSLSGVTASMIDKARGLIYVTNGDGLWIVKTKQKAEEDAVIDNYGG
jgi:hypothetical protein